MDGAIYSKHTPLGETLMSLSLVFWYRCNAYNVSSAAACLLCFLFGLSVFFDIKDLHTSNVSPRTRM